MTRTTRIIDPRLSFEELEQRFGYLVDVFARKWGRQGGMLDEDDIRQELLVVLWKTAEKYDPALLRPGQVTPASIHTYVYTAMKNRSGKVNHQANRMKRNGKNVNRPASVTLDGAEGLACYVDSAIGMVDLLTGLSPRATRLAGLIVGGETRTNQWTEMMGLREGELEVLLLELKTHFVAAGLREV
jgi:hypothetical protein